MRVKKILPLFLAIIFLITAGFGCKGMSTAEQQATKPVVLEYWTVYGNVDALQKQIGVFRSNHPYVSVNLRQLRADELYPRLIEALAEDRGPDIISVSNRDIGKFLTKLSPMPASVSDTVVTYQKNTIGNGVTALVNTQTRNLLTPDLLDQQYIKVVRNDVVRQGNIVGLPLSVDMLAVYYNKDLLDRSNVAEPPKNWNDFQDDVKKITRYDRKTGGIIQFGAAFGTGQNISASDDLLYVLFRQSGVDFVNKTGQAVFASSPLSSQVMNFYTDFANSSRDTYSWTNDQAGALDAFINGQVGFYFGYSYDYATIKARAPQFDFKVLPLFQLNPDATINSANYSVEAVTSKSKNKNEAWNLVDFLTHSQATKDYLEQAGRPTALRAYIGGQRTKPELSPFVDQILTADNWYYGKDYTTAKKALADMVEEWVSVETVSSSANNDITSLKNQVLNRGQSKINQTL